MNVDCPQPTLAAQPDLTSPPRRRKLDDVKRREVCALVSAGGRLSDAARYVRCSVRTIRREASRNPAFGEQLRRAAMSAQLRPLRAMKRAMAENWRAAAWLLERAFPERFARRPSSTFGKRHAKKLLDELVHIIRAEVTDPLQSSRIEKRLRAAFEYSTHVHSDRPPSSRDLRRAIELFDAKDTLDDPLQPFGLSANDFATPVKSPSVTERSSNTAPPLGEPQPISDRDFDVYPDRSFVSVVDDLIERVRRCRKPSSPASGAVTTSAPKRVTCGQQVSENVTPAVEKPRELLDEPRIKGDNSGT